MKAKISPLTLLEGFGITPHNKDLYEQAMNHLSYVHEKELPINSSYERLEFMGDAFLQVVSAKFLYSKYPDKLEGELTKIRSVLVRTEALARLGREINLQNMINLGKGEEKDRGLKDSIIEDCVEAFLGALYLDQGFKVAEKVAICWLKRLLLEYKDENITDYKSRLQELIQSDSREPLQYEMLYSEGKDNEKTFYYRVLHDGVVLGEGQGKTKKAAEQEAAKVALSKLAK